MTFSIQAAAARLRAGHPLLAFDTDEEQETAAQAVVSSMGGDPDDIIMVGLALDAALADPAPPPAARETALQAFADATGMSDADIAEIVGLQRVTVSLQRRGKAAENLSAAARAAMIGVLREREALVKKTLDTLA